MRRWLILCGLLAAGAARAEPPNLDFELYDFDDRLISLKRVRAGARLVLVDFFSEACKPCRAALPVWKKLHERFGGRGLAVVIVAVPGDPSDRARARREAERQLKAARLPFSSVWDKYSLVAKQYGVARDGNLEVPQVFLLSGSGALLKQAIEPKPIVAEVEKQLQR